MLPSRCEDAADAVFSTPHLCLTNPCPTHCSPAHVNVCPIRMHRLILGLSTLDQFIHIVFKTVELIILLVVPQFLRPLAVT